MLIALGYGLFRFKIADENWELVLSKYALYIGFPALILNALSKIEGSLSDYSESLLLNAAFIPVLFLLAFVVGKLFAFNKSLNSALFICAVFSNIGFMGIPILQYVYGDAVLPMGSLIASTYIFGVFTIGILYLEYQKTGRFRLFEIIINLLKNPLLLAVLIGLVLNQLKVSLASPVSEVIRMLALSVTPIIMMVVGLFMARSSFGKFKDWLAPLVFSGYTLVLMPVICMFLINVFDFGIGPNYPSVIEAAMPCAMTPFALAINYEMDKNFIARSIVLSTALSLISIPIWINILT